MTEENLIKYYFDISNESNFLKIWELFIDSSTYSSQNTGIFLGVKEILKMQKEFHESFEKLKWNINKIKELKSGIFLVDFDFSGKKKTGEEILFSGLECIVLYKWKIQHIEIKNK